MPKTQITCSIRTFNATEHAELIMRTESTVHCYSSGRPAPDKVAMTDSDRWQDRAKYSTK